MNNAEPIRKDVKIDITKPLGPQLANMPEDLLTQVLSQANSMASLNYNQGWINQVVADMKEIPVLPSEVYHDSNPIVRVDFPKEGGVLTYMKNFEYPYRGFPYYEFVDKIDTLKKGGRSFISGLYHEIKKRNRLCFLTLLPGMWFAKDALRGIIYGAYRVIERFRIKPEKYCTFIRELHRTMSITDSYERVRDAEFKRTLKDTVCMILEMDNAYRFRAQDVLVELNKNYLKKNPSKELCRLTKIMQARESDQKLIDTWTLLNYVLKFYVRFDKKLTKIIVDALMQLDMEKVKLSIEDKAYCVTRTDYTFGFQSNPNQEDQRLISKNALSNKLKEERDKLKKESDNAHQEVIKRYNPLTSEIEQKFKYEMGKLDEHYEKLLKDLEEHYALEKAKL